MAVPAWALGSTPVTVVNPTGSPVPTTINNPTASPVPTADVNNAQQPFQTGLFPTSTSNEASQSFTVPAGKRLVIEYYSAQAQDIAGGAARLILETTAGGNLLQYKLFDQVTTFGMVNQITRIYADPGTTVTAISEKIASNANSTSATVIISGYLVNVP